MTRDGQSTNLNWHLEWQADGIITAHLHKGIKYLLVPLCRIYRACVVYRFVPTACRQITLVYIPKPGEGTYTITKSFRPISLSLLLLKILEKMTRYLRYNILIKAPINKLQVAYQTGESTEKGFSLCDWTYKK